MFHVTTGSKKNQEFLSQHQLWETAAIVSGRWKKIIPLNGGSQTRRDIRNDYHARYAGSNVVKVESNAFSITLRSAFLPEN